MPRKNKTTFVILGLLSSKPRSGYDIKREVDEVVSYFWNESYGQIYPCLRNLCDNGLAVAHEEAEGGRRRVVYSITSQGKKELRRWLKEPPETETVRNEMLLKLFFGRNVSPKILARHLTAFRHRARELSRLLTEADRELKRADGPDALYLRLAARLGKRVSDARAAWAEEALGMIANKDRHDNVTLAAGTKGPQK